MKEARRENIVARSGRVHCCSQFSMPILGRHINMGNIISREAKAKGCHKRALDGRRQAHFLDYGGGVSFLR
jgi:hypothetical protein